MSLRRKTLLSMAMALAGLLLALLASVIWLNSTVSLEEQATRSRALPVSLLLICLAFGGLTLLLIDRLVLKRLARLETNVSEIAVKGDPAARIPVKGADELSALARSINSMLITLERTQRENEQLQAQLRELDRAKNQFFTNMSHELRTPLNAILGFSELLSARVSGSLTAEQQEYVHYINTSGQHLLMLINDILDLSKLQVGRVELQPASVQLTELASAAQAFVLPQVQHKRQHLINNVPPELPSVKVDPLRIKQVLINLLSNACKFTPDEGTITMHAKANGSGWLHVGVSDTGRGISADEQARLFQEFSQLDQTGVIDRGTGLGLAIARRLVELHGGRIWVESDGQPGTGSTFYFTLPLSQ